MRNTQVSVWEIQHPNTLCQYQDTMEQQGILLVKTYMDSRIMDNNSAREIRTMMPSLTKTVHTYIKAAGGMLPATHPTSMVSTMVGHTPPMLMV